MTRPLPLELGRVDDPYVRRAFEQVSLAWVDPSAPQPVTSLPIAPIDGQECYYRFAQNVTPTDAQSLVWHLRYDAALTKWLPVGAQEPVAAYDDTQRAQVFGVGWSQYTGAQVIARTPLPGIYRVKYGANTMLDATSNANLYLGITNNAGLFASAGATQPSTGLFACAGSGSPSSVTAGHASHPRITYGAGASVIFGVFVSIGQNVVAGGRYLELYPVQIG